MTDYLEPLLVSLKTVAVTTVLTFFLGIAAARWMARYSGKFKSLIDGLFILPMVLPPTVVGYGLLLVFGVNGPIGKVLLALGEKIVFSWEATVIAATVMAFPIMYMTAKGAFEQVEPNIEAAARTLGAGEWRVFWTVTLPMAKAGVIAATVLAFARSLGEFGATLMLAGNIAGKTQTIPIAIYFAIQAGDMDKAMVLCIIVLAISFVSLAAIAYWKGMAAKMKPVKVS
ncbi:MAG: molybdate ABC transporter permease subunit [Dehalococcoidales bacterium]|nr:molybdate ABC transporter permease subunit [Dehalococcoidales bacterium]